MAIRPPRVATARPVCYEESVSHADVRRSVSGGMRLERAPRSLAMPVRRRSIDGNQLRVVVAVCP